MSSFFSGFGSGSSGSGIQILAGDTGTATGTTVTIAGGTGITTSASGSTVTISATGVSTFNYTSVTTTPYVVLSTDDFLGVTTSSLAITIELPNAPATGRTYIVKDATGNAVIHNITITTVGGSVLIDGATSFIMNSAYESASFLFNGTSYLIY
jgi:hypothetical protein